MKPPLLTLALAVLLIGCAHTNPEDIAFKATGTVAVTADAVMQNWLDYKNTHAVPTNQVEAVKGAWNKYYAATQVEKDAVIAFKTGTNTNLLNSAIAAVSSASSDLVGLVLQFLPSAQGAKLKGVQ